MKAGVQFSHAIIFNANDDCRARESRSRSVAVEGGGRGPPGGPLAAVTLFQGKFPWGRRGPLSPISLYSGVPPLGAGRTRLAGPRTAAGGPGGKVEVGPSDSGRP